MVDVDEDEDENDGDVSDVSSEHSWKSIGYYTDGGVERVVRRHKRNAVLNM